MPLRLPTVEDQAASLPSGLYVVATPIGHLEDITVRAIKTLTGVNLIAAEDTRRTARLLAHYQIRTPLVSCHEHNEHQRSPELIDKIRSGSAVALVSDAGTPSLSDPGYRLICAAAEQGVPIFPIPGVSAAITALCVAALPTDAFVFIGFAPKKKGRRIELLKSLRSEPRTLVFYESPRRVAGCVADILTVMGDRPAVLAREMTKLHEEFIRGKLSDVFEKLQGCPEVKGECTLVVGGAPIDEGISHGQLDAVLREALSRPGARVSSLSKTIARAHQLSRRQVYEAALRIEKEFGQRDDFK